MKRKTNREPDRVRHGRFIRKISSHAISMAKKLKKLFAEKGYEFYIDSPTNQQFIILPNEKMEELSQRVVFSFWEKKDEDMEELAGIL